VNKKEMLIRKRLPIRNGYPKESKKPKGFIVKQHQQRRGTPQIKTPEVNKSFRTKICELFKVRIKKEKLL
jgi:hypothetical protein